MDQSPSFPLPDNIEKKLIEDDDPFAWTEILRATAEDVVVLSRAKDRERLFAIIGSCSHWARPHQSRWMAAGGFAVPRGYGDGEGFVGALPNLDWSATLLFDYGKGFWVSPQANPTKRFYSVRLAIPARTARHHQAAVHAIWSPGTLDAKYKRTVYYGFRKLELGWKLVARDERGES